MKQEELKYHREYFKKWYKKKANREKWNIRNREYYQSHKEKIKAHRRKYRIEKNRKRPKIEEIDTPRRKRDRIYAKRVKSKYGIGIATIRRYGLKTALEVYDKYHRKCAYCGEKNDLTIHHLDGKGINYLFRGLKPNNDFDNLILLCRKCHGSIHGKQALGIRKSQTKKGR